MAYFDRFDICEAYAVLEWDYNNGGWLRERPSNRRRMQATSIQLARIQFKPSPSLSYDTLEENAREIYHALEYRYGFTKSVDGTTFTITECNVLEEMGLIEPCPHAECTKDFHAIEGYTEESLREALTKENL